VPTGSVPARSQAGWLRAATAAIDDADLRTDADAALRALVWCLARWADWSRPLLSRPTWPVLMEHTNRRRSWLAGRLVWLRERGLLGVVEHGSTPATRPLPLAGLAGNRASVYLLCTPAPPVELASAAPAAPPAAPEMITDPLPVEENWTLPSSCRELDQPLRARAGAEIGSLCSPGEKPAPAGPSRRPVRPGAARSGRQEAAGELQRVCPAARRCSAAQVAALIRVFLTAGWTTGDLVYALDHGPDGVQRWYTEPVRSPAGWLRARLTDWLDGEGRPRPAHSAELAAAAADHRRRLAAQRAVANAGAAFAASPAQRQAHLAAIRVTLAARRRSA
jgi:hypothetical protein